MICVSFEQDTRLRTAIAAIIRNLFISKVILVCRLRIERNKFIYLPKTGYRETHLAHNLHFYISLFVG